MLIKHCEKPYTKSINFIDKNDIFVGYNLDQYCCEDAGWHISNNANETTFHLEDFKPNQDIDISDYWFDIDNESPKESNIEYDWDWEVCNILRFKLTNGTDTLYLYLYNYHNGYYAHEYLIKIPNKDTIEGEL